MQRLKEHRTRLSEIQKDDRLHPNNRLLALLLALKLDAGAAPRKNNGITVDTEAPFDPAAARAEEAWYTALISAQFIDKRGLRRAQNIAGGEDEDGDGSTLNLEAENEMRALFDQMAPKSAT